MRHPSRLLVAVVVAASSGCYHYAADIPGVLDTRSDGSTADPSAPRVTDETLTREGFAAFLDGQGVQSEGAFVRVEDRHLFGGATLALPGLFLLTNESAREELDAVVGEGALREVRIGHTQSALDVGVTLLLGLVPCVPLLLAPHAFSFTASGERIAAGGSRPANRPVAPPVAAPEEDAAPEAEENAPPPPPEGAPEAGGGTP